MVKETDYTVKKRGSFWFCGRGYFWYHLLYIFILLAGMIFNIYLYDKNKDVSCETSKVIKATGVPDENISVATPNPWTLLILIMGMIYMTMLIFWFPYICMFNYYSGLEDENTQALAKSSYYFKCFSMIYKFLPFY